MKQALAVAVAVSLALGAGAHAAPRKAAGTGKKGVSHSNKYVYNPGKSPVAIDAGGRPITVAMIEQKWLQITPNERPPQDSSGVNDLVHALIDKAYMGWILEERGYQLNPAEQKAYDDYKTTTLRNFLYAAKMKAAGKVSEAQLRSLWKQQGTDYYMHQLAVKSRARADSLSAALRKGADFGELARAFSIDPQTQLSGGDIGIPMNAGFMHPAVESTVVAMKPGQVSGPVEGGSEYFWVLRVDSIGSHTPPPFESARSGLESRLVQSRQNEERRNSIKTYIKQAQVEFVDSVVAFVAARYDSVLKTGEGIDESSGAAKVDLSGKYPRFSAEQRGWVLLRSRFGSMTVAELMDPIARMEGMFRPKLRTPDGLKIYAGSIAAGPAIDEDMLRHRIDRENYAVRDLRDRREYLLAQRFFSTEIARDTVPEDSIQTFYESKKDSFYLPEQTKVQFIVVSDSSIADSLSRQVKLGDDMGRIAGEFSEDGATGKNGGVSEFFERHAHDMLFGAGFDSLAFALPPPYLAEAPVRLSGGRWVIMKGLGRKEVQMLDYTQARKFAREFLNNMRQERLLRAALDGARKRRPLRVYWDQVRKVRLGNPPDESVL